MHINWMMTRNPFVTRPEVTVNEAHRCLVSHRIKHLPVVSGAGILIGMLSEKDLERALDPSRNSGLDVSVRSVMKTHPITVDSDADVDEALDIMLEHGVGALPVVDRTGDFVGIVSFGDCARVLGWQDPGRPPAA